MRAALDRIQRIESGVGDGRQRIGELEEATRQVRMRIALEFKRDRRAATVQPQLAAHDAFLAIINLAAHHAVVNSEGHAESLPEAADEERNSSGIKFRSNPPFPFPTPKTGPGANGAPRRKGRPTPEPVSAKAGT